MAITDEEIAKIAVLAHLDISQSELQLFAPQINGIVSYVEQLNELDTALIEPATGGLTAQGAATDSARADVALTSLGQRLALDQAPDPAAGHFRVPKVL